MLTDLIPLPYRILALAGFAAALAGGGYVAGLRHADAAHDALDALHAKQDATQHAADVEKARKQETTLRAKIDDATTQRLKDKTDHEAQLAAVRAAARAGAVVLRCPIAALPAEPKTADSAAASGPVAEDGRGRIVPQAADDLLGIAGSIRAIVRDRNDLIQAYNAARATCNGE